MIAKKSNHIIPTAKGWVVKKSGASRASKIFTEKSDAVLYGIKLSKEEKTELYTHTKNGTIQSKKSFINHESLAVN
ncbi:MAG TPA: DUF2188 domain-containing protein [Saprospiraceae bacterium]|nr:DUF2188 domain-containing protein [Saprospiraceae bacterium]